MNQGLFSMPMTFQVNSFGWVFIAASQALQATFVALSKSEVGNVSKSTLLAYILTYK